MTDLILQDATPHQLELAAAFNHTELFSLEAATLGGHILQSGGLTWTSGSPHSGSMIAFPQLHPDEASDKLDELIAFYLRYPPHGAGCWSLDPPAPTDIGVRLLARGFQTGWRPRWMALDLPTLNEDHSTSPDLKIVLDNKSSLHRIKDLPYAQVIIPTAHTRIPGQWARFVAHLKGKVVGHSVVFLTTGELGAAGIYHVGVIPAERRKGIGKAITLAACRYARDKGYRYAVLNSTDAGRRTYEQLGFKTVGEGWTWWLVMDRLLNNPPSPTQIILAEAVGTGNLSLLNEIAFSHHSTELNQPMTNGMTLVQLAVTCRQHAAAEWLVRHGAQLTVLDAWDLGWKDRAADLLQETPHLVNQRYGEWDKCLLHFAAERNDTGLTRLALTAGPNLQLKDKNFQATPLDWANHFGHSEIARLILQH